MQKLSNTEALFAHVSKVSVKELQWNPNRGLNVTAALSLQAPTL